MFWVFFLFFFLLANGLLFCRVAWLVLKPMASRRGKALEIEGKSAHSCRANINSA